MIEVRASELAPRRTKIGQLAGLAAGSSRDTDPPAVLDEPQADRAPPGGGKQLTEVLLDLDRVARVAQPEALAQPCHVGVDRQPRKAEGHREHDIRGLATDPRQGGQLIHRPGQLTGMTHHDRLGGTEDVRCLRAEEACGPDQGLELVTIGGGEIARCGITLEQQRHHDVDPLVGALGREDGRDEQLEGVVVDQRAQLGRCARICRGEPIGDLAGPRRRRPRPLRRRVLGTLDTLGW